MAAVVSVVLDGEVVVVVEGEGDSDRKGGCVGRRGRGKKGRSRAAIFG
jgi:hypothetical protein